ncbi:hypothetical protein D3C78_1626200 [compost metagenome]
MASLVQTSDWLWSSGCVGLMNSERRRGNITGLSSSGVNIHSREPLAPLSGPLNDSEVMQSATSCRLRQARVSSKASPQVSPKYSTCQPWRMGARLRRVKSLT